jgi:hypothetical protein
MKRRAESVMLPSVVLDKNFLHGSKKTRIHDLSKTHRMIVSEALFYELLTTSERERILCFSKFPSVDNPVDLVSHIGALMRIEIETHRPSGKPSTHREQINFQFNPHLLNLKYELPEDARLAIEEQTAQLHADVQSFIERASLIESFFPNLLIGSDSQRFQEREQAERAIAEPGSLLPFYASLEPPPGQVALPPATIVNENWALYRWLQVQFLFALDLYVRYGGAVPDNLSPATYEKIEHDVLDAQLMMLGCLEGAFATNEKKLVRWWRLICPSGTLLQTDSK